MFCFLFILYPYRLLRFISVVGSACYSFRLLPKFQPTRMDRRDHRGPNRFFFFFLIFLLIYVSANVCPKRLLAVILRQDIALRYLHKHVLPLCNVVFATRFFLSFTLNGEYAPVSVAWTKPKPFLFNDSVSMGDEMGGNMVFIFMQLVHGNSRNCLLWVFAGWVGGWGVGKGNVNICFSHPCKCRYGKE